VLSARRFRILCPRCHRDVLHCEIAPEHWS